MCTNFALIKSSGTTQMAHRLGIDDQQLLYSSNMKPGSRISIVREHQGERGVLPAIWWLYLQQTDEGLRPHKDYFSVNTNHAKLASKPEYRKTRCIILATAYVESQEGKHPYLLEPDDGSAFAFGGLYKEWVDKTSGEIVHSASIITLAGHEALAHIHRKSMPLWLPDNEMDAWLDERLTETDSFTPLLTPALRTPLRCTPIDKTFTKIPIGEPFHLVYP